MGARSTEVVRSRPGGGFQMRPTLCPWEVHHAAARRLDAIDPIAHIVRVRTAAIVVARRGMFGRLIRQMVTRRERPREHQIAMVVWSVPVCVRRVCVMWVHEQRQRCSLH